MTWKDIKWNAPVDKGAPIFDERYHRPLAFSLVYQLIIMLLAGMMLDGGQCAQYALVAMSAFWGSVILLVLRRRWNPSKFDILYIRLGYFPILFSVPPIMEFAWRLRGVL